MSSAVQKVFQILLYILILVYSIMYKILSFSVWYTFVSEILSMILTLFGYWRGMDAVFLFEVT